MTTSKPITWRLAPGYLAAGKVNLLVGDEGIGKSLWTIRAIAATTTGTPWGPFTIETQPADAILVATEDGWSDTIRPRLEVADADLNRLHLFCAEEDGTGVPVIGNDIQILQRSGVTPALVVVDAWVDTVPGGLQIKDPQKARQAMAPWKTYAAQTGAAVLLVTHTNRAASQDIRNKFGLSGALRQVSRTTMFAIEDPDDTGTLLVGPDKSNLGAKGAAHRFTRTPVEHFTPTVDSDGTVARLDSLGPDRRTVEDVVAEQCAAPQPGSKTAERAAWLGDLLKQRGGSISSTELFELGLAEGYSDSQVRRAREELGMESYRDGEKWMVRAP